MTWKSASSPSGSSISTTTASSSPSRSRTTRARRCAQLRLARRVPHRLERADRKQAIVEELAKQGVFLDELAEQVGRDFDAFDLVCHVAFDQPPLTRKERAEQVSEAQRLHQVWREGRAVLDALLDKYADGGIESVESLESSKSIRSPTSARRSKSSKLFGGKANYLAAIRELETALYQKAA